MEGKNERDQYQDLALHLSFSSGTELSDSYVMSYRGSDGCFGDAVFNGAAPARNVLFGNIPCKQRVEKFSIQDSSLANRCNMQVNLKRDTPVLQDPSDTFARMNQVMHQTLKYVKEVESIDFSSSNIIDFNGEIMEDPRRVFLSVCTSVFANFSFCSQLDVEKLLSFLSDIFENYSEDNAYHNAVHAADSVQMLYLILREKPAILLFTNEEILVCFLATLCLSFIHPGVTDAFLARIDHPLTLVYGDVTTQRSASLTAFLYFLNREENRFIDLSSSAGTRPISQYLRELLVETVLATAPRSRRTLLSDLQDVAASNVVSVDDLRFLLSAIVTLSDSALALRPRAQFISWSRLLCAEWLSEATQEERRRMDPLVPNLQKRVGEGGLTMVSDYCRVWLRPVAAATRALVPQDLYDNLERNSDVPTFGEVAAFSVPDVSADKPWSDGSLSVFEILRKVTMHAKSLDRKASKRAILNATCGRLVSAPASQLSSPFHAPSEPSISCSPVEKLVSHPSRCEHYFSFLRLYDTYDREGRPATEFAEQLVFLAMQLNPDYVGRYAREGIDASSKEDCSKIASLIIQSEEAPSTAEVIASPLRGAEQTDGFILRLMEMYTERDRNRNNCSVQNSHTNLQSTSRCLLPCSNPVYGGMDRGRK
ncbi:cAMP-specific phosphodiesterase, putative [Trypanosoma brucei brucei TREU927]|uniref:cAMP-specific phosphodiesterase, putative n=1 Tax=Trypanosoma brucei brucei (strain 927/4 GUTat10.1) TaxID=185431 RepID=Q38EQ0_TRYB2|nr:cAMP-specific phosphodiesterase, putative [Trypanosoma brucei brucei TREU927]EAN76720.1 cAMP-specific phosphodiesterase, putative [Trypanosoma brucei brucei TREU927]